MTRSQRMVLLALDSNKLQSSANNKSTPKFDPLELDPDPFDVGGCSNMISHLGGGFENSQKV